MYVLEHEISPREFLNQGTDKQVVTWDKLKLHGTRDLWKGYLDPIHSNRLPWLKHEELRSSKTARRWKNPLYLGESPPPAVLPGLAGAGLKLSLTPNSASKYLL